MDNVTLILVEIEKGIMPVNEIFYIIKAEFLFDKKDFINSAHYCHEAINVNPHCVGAHLLLCNIYLELNMFDNADFEIKTTLYINKQLVLTYYFYYIYCKKIGDSACPSGCIDKINQIVKDSDFILMDNAYPLNAYRRKHITDELKKIIAE